MSYIAKNIQIFTAAFAGALAGMGLSDRVISNTDPVQYAGLATIAGAFAQAVDTAWTDTRATTLLDVEAIQSNSAAYWQDRSPNADSTNTNPSTFAAAALSIIATITASESYYASQGITPPAIPGGTSGGFPNVANLTSLGAIDWTANGLANGYRYYVQTQRSYWILSQTGTETVNGNTVIAANGGGRWLRDLSFAHPSWLIVNNWYIDATNGNDENNGQASVNAPNNVGPLKTYSELARRWNNGIIRPSTAVSTSLVCKVQFLTSLPASDPVYSACSLGPQALLWFNGQVETVNYSGTFTGVTARNPATNSPTILTDTSLTVAPQLGKRWRVTTAGARFNTMGWIAKDLGANSFRSSCPQVPGNMRQSSSASWPLLFGGTQQDPVVGDTYNIETLTTISFGNISNFMINGGATGNGCRIVVGELAIRAAGFTSSVLNFAGATPFAIYSTDFQSVADVNANIGSQFSNCSFEQGISVVGGLTEFVCGLVSNQLASATGLVVGLGGGIATLAGAIMFQGVNVKARGIYIVDACVFDCPSNTANPGGHGIVIGKNQSNASAFPQNPPSWGQMQTRLWGSGNAGAGVYVNASSYFNYTSGSVAGLTITGTGGDFRLNNKTTANVWDQTANAGAGAWLVPRNCTWANLVAAIGAAGLGGFANDVESGARIASAV